MCSNGLVFQMRASEVQTLECRSSGQMWAGRLALGEEGRLIPMNHSLAGAETWYDDRFGTGGNVHIRERGDTTCPLTSPTWRESFAQDKIISFTLSAIDCPNEIGTQVFTFAGTTKDWRPYYRSEVNNFLYYDAGCQDDLINGAGSHPGLWIVSDSKPSTLSLSGLDGEYECPGNIWIVSD